MTTQRTIRRAAAAIAMMALGACAEDPAPPFEVEGTGSITGQLFFDADNNGLFTPIGGDTLLRDVEIELRERGSTVLIASTQTDAAGTFEFEGVAPGTHDVLLVQDTAVTKNLIFCSNPVRASVYRDETAFISAPAKRGCVVAINIAEADTLNASVTVAGIVTAAQGTYRGDNTYIQDPTGGIMAFGIPGSAALVLGDSVEISGVLGQFNGELQINNPIVAPNRTRTTVPAPAERTTGAIAAAVAAGGAKARDVGLLLVVRAARVGAFTSGGGRNATLNDGSGAIEIRLDGNVINVIPTTRFDQTKCYDIIGILGFFNGAPQLKPRIASDVVEVPCP
jgi:DNA/RNA endonuclease YhcR with UshA esterase domain